MHFQNTDDGSRSVAVASGALVRAEYHVELRDIAGQEREGDVEWVLVENASVECSPFLMPFVKRSFEGAHKDIVRMVVEKVAKKHVLEGVKPSQVDA